jgi:putative ABC transport system permease protein
MFKSSLITAFRSLTKQKAFSVINILGLAVGMACCLLISVYVANELSFENFHANRQRIYRVSVGFGQKDSQMKMVGVMPALAPAMIEQFPEVENAVRFQIDPPTSLTYQDTQISNVRQLFADSCIFDVFSFRLIEGNSENALQKPFSVVISKKLARKYFGGENPLGKTVMYDKQYPMQITGIMEDVPPNTHLKFDMLISYSSLDPLKKSTSTPWNHWGDCYTYILLRKNASIEGMETKISQLLASNTSENFAKMFTFYLLPLPDIHFTQGFFVELEPATNPLYIKLLIAVSIFILVIACFNFINLSTARSIKRVREIGIRKVLGAKRNQLIFQFLSESMLIAFFAIVLGLVLFEIFYPTLNAFLGNTLSVHEQKFWYLIIFVPAILLIIGIFAGSYPAFYFSRSPSIECLKSDVLLRSSRSLSRRILVIAQFIISILLIIGTLTVFRQLRFLIGSDLGFDKNNVVLVDLPFEKGDLEQKYVLLKDEFEKNPNILGVSGAYVVPGVNNCERKGIRLQGGSDDDFQIVQTDAVDSEFVDVLGLRIEQGKDLSSVSSSRAHWSVLLNQAAVSSFHMQDPIGKTLEVSMEGGLREATVVGVISNFHLYSKHESIEPLMLYLYPPRYMQMAIRIRPGHMTETLAFLNTTWKRISPESSWYYSFLDETYDRLYVSEEKIGQLFTVSSIVALIIAALGLIGLASFLTDRRTKEIGIRKVLGASLADIVALLTREFVILVAIAGIFATPVAYYLMSRWLQNYAYHININGLVFLLAVAIALVIAATTISFQAVKAAIANPVDSLKYE